SDPNPQMEIYRKNMAKYAPDIDISGFIAVNYYHDGWISKNVLGKSGITFNLIRKTIVDAANNFGPFDTGFGNTVRWRPENPRVASRCAHIMTVKGDTWSYNP